MRHFHTTRFRDIVGHAAPLDAIATALKGGRLAHGLLFHGPEGVGKATVSDALMRRMLCQQTEEEHAGGAGFDFGEEIDGDRALPQEACGACASCTRLETGSHPDLLTLTMEEGRTRILVEQVKELSHFIALTPLLAPYKVAVVDDAAEMNLQAANALLKTLEEPPPQSLIILITRSPGSLLPTIRSRCHAIRFQPLEEKALYSLLCDRMAESSEGEASRQSLKLAAQLADGRVSKAVELAESDWLKNRQELWQEMARLCGPQNRLALGDVNRLAKSWAAPERFNQGVELLELWFREQIHATLADRSEQHEGLPPPPPIGGMGNHAAARQWLELAERFQKMVREQRTFNVNRQLMLETILIEVVRSLPRLQGGGGRSIV
uniref:Putative DNA polymerase III, delta prime subunit n=1 Tax=Magnetococcus massalia (strain MO-1) TaxID=451514 RepID=A0A1S7LDM1_MAGMO|nr:putative DNA polymerase III, delta prime subunit [Candidatus Magnetococcus massalia]